MLAVNVLVGLLGCLFAAGLIRELLTPLPPAPAARRRARRGTGRGVRPGRHAGRRRAGAYGVVASRNLFSPSRSEAPTSPVVAAGPKPLLHGVVMDGLKSRAYLEDPAAKRTFGYAVGDTVAGGRVQSISDDRVVIARPDGLVEVLLQDPAKPKPGRPRGRRRDARRRPTGPAPPGIPAPRVPAASGPATSQRAMIGRAPTASWLLLVLVTAGCASATPGGVRVSEPPAQGRGHRRADTPAERAAPAAAEPRAALGGRRRAARGAVNSPTPRPASPAVRGDERCRPRRGRRRASSCSTSTTPTSRW